MKYRSTFFTEETIKKIRGNSIGSEVREQILERAKKWREPSYDDLWQMIFGSELKRSRCVFTDGYCPSCRQTVHMYGWLYDPFKEPWKVWCPHCGERFPKNDFKKYYESGLDGHYEFDFELADKRLLYNEDAPDPADPDHKFCVDDGRGYRSKDGIWFFVGHYILHGVWYNQICEGINILATAYLMTGDVDYAVRCGIMIDRIADLFPKYNYYTQGYTYIQKDNLDRGYVAVWCDIVRHLHNFLLAYDAIFDVIKSDKVFLSYVMEKSKKYRTPYRKESFVDIQTNIENRIFGDAMANEWKIASNPPWPKMFDALTKMVLTEWPVKPEDMEYNVYIIMWWMPERILKEVIEDSTKIDGLSGEKGFISYSSIAVAGTAILLSWISLYDKDIIKKMTDLYPGIIGGLRFLMNSWLLCSYYPGCGDTNTWTTSSGISISPGYAAFGRNNIDETVIYSYEGFLWNLYRISGDINILRFMYNSENYDMEKLFSTDLTLDRSPDEIRGEMKRLMEEHGSELEQHSMNAEKWKIALLHSGKGRYKRAAYLDYDSGGVHGHNDGMNIGLYAEGMNFLPDLGYPPTHRKGGFHSEFFYWYRSAASHNTAIVDGIEHRDYCWYQRDVKGGQGIWSESGETVLWGIGSWIKAVAADDPGTAGSERFERLLAMVDLSDEDCYFFDIFRIKGGSEHVKLTHGGLDCTMRTNGLDPEPYEVSDDPFGAGFIRDRNPVVNIPYTFEAGFKFVRDMQITKNAGNSWDAQWEYLYRYNKVLKMPEGKKFTLLYKDLTQDIDVIGFRSFVDSFGFINACDPDSLKGSKGHPEIMRPGIAVRRKNEDGAGLESVFIGIYDASGDGSHCVKSAKRLEIEGYGIGNSGPVGFEVETSCGTDLILASDVQDRKTIMQKDWDVKTDASLSILRKYKESSVKLTMMQGSYYEYGTRKVMLETALDLYETEI